MMEEWEFLWNRTLKITKCIILQETPVKMFYRWYVTPEVIARMSKSKASNKCWKCPREKGILPEGKEILGHDFF